MNIGIKKILTSLLAIAGVFAGTSPANAERPAPDNNVTVSMTVTASVADGKRMPSLNRNDISVKQGKENLRIANWTPAQGSSAGLDLFILIDEGADSSLALHLDDLRTFIGAQPATTLVGVGYTRNATVQIQQELTTDHELAAKALRMPSGYSGAYASPYLSVADLMRRWPEDKNRREVLMLSDGVDRMGRSAPAHRGFTVNPDEQTAAAVAHRTGTVIHSIYVPAARRARLGYWPRTNGQTQMASLSQKTGGKSFYLGLQMPVSLKPYLDELQTTLANQYVLSFSAKPGNKPGLRSVKLSTEVAGVTLTTHEAVWVPASLN